MLSMLSFYIPVAIGGVNPISKSFAVVAAYWILLVVAVLLGLPTVELILKLDIRPFRLSEDPTSISLLTANGFEEDCRTQWYSKRSLKIF